MKTKTERVVPKEVKQTAKLNEDQWEKLNKLISAPPKPTEALKRLMKNL